MSSSNRAAIIGKIHRVLKKHYKPIPPQTGRSVLDHLLYACCLENARFEAADEAFAKVQQSYFDLNEVRVTTASELCEVLGVLPDSSSVATSLKRALQGVFECHFDFDLEFLRKQNLGKSEKDLEKYTSANPFLVAYVVQHGLAGHAIPCGRSECEVLMIAGLISEADAEKRQVPGLERAIPKNKGLEFASLLHQLAADYVLAPHSPKVRAILLEIDPESKDRFPKRGPKKEEPPLEPKKKAEPETSAADAKKKLPEKTLAPKSDKHDKKEKGDKHEKVEKADHRPKDKKEMSKSQEHEQKKSAAKGLAKKKPR